MADLIGTKIAGYRIESLLSRGGMGEVYLAEQDAPRRKVALKLLAPELSEDAGFRERFARESEAAASIDHPNVIPIYQSGQADGALFIAMRYVEGTDLRTLLAEQGPLPSERAIAICAQIADALEAAHERGLVHRDVKPANILVGRKDHAYLSDFGLIRRSEVSTAITKTGQFMGTIDYVAPEQIKGQAVDGRADIYSLGCVLYECLTGEAPFRRETEVATLYAHLEDPPPLPSAKVAATPPALDTVVATAIANAPEERFAAARDLSAAIRSVSEPVGVVRERRRAPRGLLIIGATIAMILILVVALANRPDGVERPRRAAPAPPVGSLLAIDPGSEKIGTTVPKVFAASGFESKASIELGEGGIWVGSQHTLTHVDERTNAIRATIPSCAAGLAIASRMVWLADLQRVDPATDETLRPILTPSQLARMGASPVGTCDTSVAAGAGAVWFGLGSGQLLVVDPFTGRLKNSIDLAANISDLAFGEGSLWVADDLAGTVTRVEPRTLEEGIPIEVQGDLDRIDVGLGKIWVLDKALGAVTPIDADTGAVGSPIRVGRSPVDLVVGLGSVWVANQGEGTISEINPVTEREVRTIPVGGPVAAIAVDEVPGTLWVVLGKASGFG